MVEKFIMAGATPLHVCDSEEGDTTVVLLHGYLENMLVWDDFVPLLYRSVRVVTLDLPGHGVSKVESEVHTMEWLSDVVADALTTLGIDHAFVVGHSMGGYVALAFCERHAERCDGLVLLSSTPNPDSEEKRKNREREIAIVRSGKKDLLATTAPEAGFAVDNRKRMSSYIEDLTEIIHLTDDDGIIALLGGMKERADRNEMLRQSPVPQLFILGRKDPYIIDEVASAMVESHPQAEVLWLEESGHMGFIEEPKHTAEGLLDFCLRHSRA